MTEDSRRANELKIFDGLAFGYLLSVNDSAVRIAFSGSRDEIRHLFQTNIQYAAGFDIPEERARKFAALANKVVQGQSPFTQDIVAELQQAAKYVEVCAPIACPARPCPVLSVV